MALSKQKTLKGTVLKMAVNFECPGNDEATLERINFFTEWYCTSKRLKIEKAQHVFEDGQCYAYVDTGKIGTYWANTSSNGLVSKLVREGDAEIKNSFEDLLKGKCASGLIFPTQILLWVSASNTLNVQPT